MGNTHNLILIEDTQPDNSSYVLPLCTPFQGKKGLTDLFWPRACVQVYGWGVRCVSRTGNECQWFKIWKRKWKGCFFPSVVEVRVVRCWWKCWCGQRCEGSSSNSREDSRSIIVWSENSKNYQLWTGPLLYDLWWKQVKFLFPCQTRQCLQK